MSDERIRGSVAQILTEREVVINRGVADGVEVGMRFAILNSKGANITDPETGAELGSVDVDKALVKVVRVHEHMSVARTFRSTLVGGFGVTGFSEMFGGPTRSIPETLRAEGKTYKQELDDADSLVKRGDPVVQVVGDEFDPKSAD